MKCRYVSDTRAEQYLGKICFNMAYPSYVAGSPFSSVVTKHQTDNPTLRAAVLESIKKEGFRNPIIAYTCLDGLLFKFGQTRLQHAETLDIDLPCIVADYHERYTDRPEVTNDNYADFFTDPPADFEIVDGTVVYSYNLGPHNQHQYDPAGLEWIGDDPTGALNDLRNFDREQYLKDRLRGSTAGDDQG